MRVLPSILLLACGPGQLVNAEGPQPLRTALYGIEVSEEQSIATVFLSNGEFGCALQETPDPSERLEAQTELLAAACREDARHLLLRFSRPVGTSWEEAYDGAELGDRGPLFDPLVHEVSARYHAIIEAQLAREDGLVRQFSVSEEENLLIGPGGTGTLLNPEEGVLEGSYDAPSQQIGARFRAIECEPEDDVFRVVSTIGRLDCETP